MCRRVNSSTSWLAYWNILLKNSCAAEPTDFPRVNLLYATHENIEHGFEPADWPIATLPLRRPMGFTLTVSCASESVMVMEKDLSLQIGLTVHRPLRIILFLLCSWWEQHLSLQIGLTVRLPLRSILTVSWAAKSMMEQDLSLLIGPLYANQWESLLFFFCSWVSNGTGLEPSDWPTAWYADQWESFLLFLVQLSL